MDEKAIHLSLIIDLQTKRILTALGCKLKQERGGKWTLTEVVRELAKQNADVLDKTPPDVMEAIDAILSRKNGGKPVQREQRDGRAGRRRGA